MVKSSLVNTVLASTVVLVLLVGLMLGLHLVQTANENALISEAHPLPTPTGELSAEAEELPLAADLWNKARYYDFSAYETADYGEPAATHGFEEFEAICQGLFEAGVIPQGAAPEGSGHSSTVESQAIAKVFVRFGSALLHQGKVVNLWLIAPKAAAQAFDQDAACLAYVDYLGLGGLGDWRQAQLFEPEFQHIAAYYSGSAQLLVQITADERAGENDVSIGLTVTPISREAFAGQSLTTE